MLPALDLPSEFHSNSVQTSGSSSSSSSDVFIARSGSPDECQFISMIPAVPEKNYSRKRRKAYCSACIMRFLFCLVLLIMPPYMVWLQLSFVEVAMNYTDSHYFLVHMSYDLFIFFGCMSIFPFHRRSSLSEITGCMSLGFILLSCGQLLSRIFQVYLP